MLRLLIYHCILALAHALSGHAFSALRDLELYWEDAECDDHSYDTASLLNAETGIDELSVALRTVAQLPSLQKLQLTGRFIVAPEIFQPINSDSDSLSSKFPSLGVIKLHLSAMTPSGDWYYTGDPDSIEASDERMYDSEEEEEVVDSADSETEDYPAVWDWQKLNGQRPSHPWRNQPNPATFDLFLRAMALAIPHMPALRRVELRVGNAAGLLLETEFLAAGEKGTLFNQQDTELVTFDETFRNQSRWEIVLTNNNSAEGDSRTVWEISDDLKQAWKDSTGSDDKSVIIVNGGSWGSRMPV